MSIKEVLEKGSGNNPGYLSDRNAILARENPYKKIALEPGSKLLKSNLIQGVLSDFEETIGLKHPDLVITEPELNESDFSVGITAKWNFRSFGDGKLCDTITVSTALPFDTLEINGKVVEVLGSGRWGHKNRLEEAIVRGYQNPFSMWISSAK
jgi:hypothetical protein